MEIKWKSTSQSINMTSTQVRSKQKFQIKEIRARKIGWDWIKRGLSTQQMDENFIKQLEQGHHYSALLEMVT